MNNREAMQKAFEGQKFKVFSPFKCDISKNEDGNYVDDETIFAFAWFCRGIASQAQQPTDLSKQLREYAADSGYSHNDYADTMLAAASEIERLTTSQEQQEPSKDIHEAITLLSAVFDAWENGTDCYDDFDGVSGSFIGKAFNLDDEIFKRCCDLLNRVNPPRNVSQAQQESKPVIAYEVRAYGRMQKIIVRDDVAEEYADKLKADGCENVEVRDLVYALPPAPEGGDK